MSCVMTKGACPAGHEWPVRKCRWRRKPHPLCPACGKTLSKR